jgi:hypothetical protein
MFEKYMICTRDFGNVSSNGQVTGFQVKIRINYYRGCYLSMIDTLRLVVDGQEYPTSHMTFSVPEHGRNVTSPAKVYTFAELAKATTVRWFFGDAGTLTVEKPGGLSTGMHIVQLGLFIRNSYVPRFDPEGLFSFFGGGGERGANGATGYGIPPNPLPLVASKKMSLV